MHIEQKIDYIVIGGDHHNTLAACRCLGKSNQCFSVIIHTEETNIQLRKSSYVNDYKVVKNSENEILQSLLSLKTQNKQVIVPCSDLSAYVVDKHAEALYDYYYIPGFLSNRGLLCKLMDKYQQYLFATEHNIEMARSICLSLNNSINILADIKYPCILKPIVSAFGVKNDIRICYSISDLEAAISELKEKAYTTVLLQEFLKKKYEVCSFGCLINQKVNGDNSVGCIIKKIRETRKGSTSYASIFSNSVIDKKNTIAFSDETRKLGIDENDYYSIHELNAKILFLLFESGYRGQYDIEIFVCDDGIFLNEINFRQSGNGYVLPSIGIDIPVITGTDMLGRMIGTIPKLTIGIHNMDEVSDVMHVKNHEISLFNWLKEYKRTESKCIFDRKDMKGTMAFYGALIKYVLKSIVNKEK